MSKTYHGCDDPMEMIIVQQSVIIELLAKLAHVKVEFVEGEGYVDASTVYGVTTTPVHFYGGLGFTTTVDKTA